MKFPLLKTDRLVLRRVLKQDAEDLYRILGDEEIMRYFGAETYTSIEQMLDMIAWYDYSYRERDAVRFGIALKGTDRLIGTCGFHSWEPTEYRAEVVAVLAKEYWNQGYMTEALRRVMRYGYEEMNLFRIQAKVEPPNIASRKMFENLGFQEEGTLRSFAYINHEFRDKIVYSRLKTDR